MTEKIGVWQGSEISPEGVTRVWIWYCPKCGIQGYTLFWENTLRSAQNHIKWHEKRDANAQL